MSKDSLSRVGRVYSVAFDSILGVQIRNYLQRGILCENAIRDFLYSVEQKYSFPIHVTDNTQYCLGDDCDAGGLIAILVPKSELDVSRLDARSRVLWDYMESPDDEDMLCFFPRVEAHTRYIKYGLAVRLFEHQAPDWDFQPANLSEQQKKLKLHVVRYDEIRKRISQTDLLELVHRPGTTPSPSMRIAVGRQYVLNEETLADMPARALAIHNHLNDAIALYKEWSGLPVVAANSLARTLRLSMSGHEDAAQCFCEWRVDDANKRYLIHTGLVSLLAEMVETTDPSALSLFD